jgi:hypothetical protein
VAYLLVVLTMMRVTSNFLLKMIIYKGNACLHTYVLHRGESTLIVRYLVICKKNATLSFC